MTKRNETHHPPMSPLMRELLICNQLALQSGAAASLRATGITSGRLVGIDFVSVHGRTYQRSVGGTPAFIIPSFILAADRPVLIDLVAIDVESRRPSTRCGMASMLGSEWIDAATTHGRCVPVYLDGLRWLGSGCSGVLVIDPDLAAHALADAPCISCSDTCTAATLHDAQTKPLRAPSIFISEAVHDARKERR